MIELRHEFPVRAAGGVQVVVTGREPTGGSTSCCSKLLILLECVNIGRRAETTFVPSMSPSRWESFFSRAPIEGSHSLACCDRQYCAVTVRSAPANRGSVTAHAQGVTCGNRTREAGPSVF